VIPIGDGRRVPIFPFAVYALVVLNVFVFVREVELPTDVARSTFIDAFALIPFDLTHGVQLAPPAPATALTLVTSQFLHGSVFHIFFNMLFLLVFGPQIEALTGHVRFAGFYLLCGIAGNLAQLSVGPGSHVPSIGASGAIAGVLGAYIVRFPTNTVDTIVPIGCFPLFLRLPAILVIGIWAATQFVHGFGPLSSRVLSEQGGTVAYFAHIGGFLAGVLSIGLFAQNGRARQGPRYRFHH
jgi:membrane associated rhomboid family serine protease